MHDEDLTRIANSPQLRYPVATKADFVVQMAQAPTVIFHGTRYTTSPVAELIPDFFFPLTSPDDLVMKASELVASRGLETEVSPVASPRVPGGARSRNRTVEEVMADVEAIVMDPDVPETDQERVEALDIVTHALQFVGHPQALALWRDATAGHFRAETREAVATLLQQVTTFMEEGDYDAVTRICDCLFDLYDVEAPAHVGGLRIDHSLAPSALAAHTDEGA